MHGQNSIFAHSESYPSAPLCCLQLAQALAGPKPEGKDGAAGTKRKKDGGEHGGQPVKKEKKKKVLAYGAHNFCCCHNDMTAADIPVTGWAVRFVGPK